jgi:hypothetical protein
MTNNKDIAMDSVVDIIEAHNCIYNSLTPREYKGIDGIVELIIDEKPIHSSFATHIVNFVDLLEVSDTELKIDLTEFHQYFVDFDLPVFLFFIDSETRNGFWFQFDKSIPPQSLTFIKSNSNCFSFKHFHTHFLDILLNNEKKYEDIERHLRKDENEIIRAFLISTFRILENAIPYILKYPNSKDYFNSLDIKVFPRKPDVNEIPKWATKDGVDIFVRSQICWYVKGQEGDFYMPFDMFFFISQQYNLISKR